MTKKQFQANLSELNIEFDKSATKKQLEEQFKDVNFNSSDDNNEHNSGNDNFKVALKFKLLGGKHKMNDKVYVKDDIIITNMKLDEKFKNKFIEVK